MSTQLETSSERSRARREALLALLLVLLPYLVLTAVAILMRGPARQAVETQTAGQFGPDRLLRQVGLNAFALLPMGIWLRRRQSGWAGCGWGRTKLWRATLIGVLLGTASLVLRARPFAPERLTLADTWWALATYGVVALAEETLFRGFLQIRLAAWLGRWWGYLITTVVFTANHLPARFIGGEPLGDALTYAGTQLLPMALLFGGAMLVSGHRAAPTLVHLAWNWASMLRST